MSKYSELRKKINRRTNWSIILSAIFHPLLLPTYTLALIGYFSPLAIAPLNSFDGLKFLISLIFLSTFFLPFLLLTLYIIITKPDWKLRNFFMEDSRERVFPFLAVGAFYSVLVYYMRQAPQLNEVILFVMICVTLSVLTVALISYYWKISAHAVGISGMLGILALINVKIPDAQLFYPFVIMVFLAGLLLSARLRLNAHSPLQIGAGILVGLALSSIGYWVI